MATMTTDITTTALGVCTGCGAEMPADAAFCPACGRRVGQAAPAPAPAPGGPVPAGLLARGAAFVVDYFLLAFVLWTAVVVVDGLAGGGVAALTGLGLVAAGQLYWAGMESGRWQASVGKQAFRLVVVNVDGSRMTFNRALMRSALSIAPLVAAELFIASGADILGGVLMLFVVPGAVLLAPFTTRRQALHDLATGTMVARPPHA